MGNTTEKAPEGTLEDRLKMLEEKVYNLEKRHKKCTVEDIVNRDLTGASIFYIRDYVLNAKANYPEEFAKSINAHWYDEFFLNQSLSSSLCDHT